MRQESTRQTLNCHCCNALHTQFRLCLFEPWTPVALISTWGISSLAPDWEFEEESAQSTNIRKIFQEDIQVNQTNAALEDYQDYMQTEKSPNVKCKIHRNHKQGWVVVHSVLPTTRAWVQAPGSRLRRELQEQLNRTAGLSFSLFPSHVDFCLYPKINKW